MPLPGASDGQSPPRMAKVGAALLKAAAAAPKTTKKAPSSAKVKAQENNAAEPAGPYDGDKFEDDDDDDDEDGASETRPSETVGVAVPTGACGYNRPCAHQYVGKYQSCMV